MARTVEELCLKRLPRLFNNLHQNHTSTSRRTATLLQRVHPCVPPPESHFSPRLRGDPAIPTRFVSGKVKHSTNSHGPAGRLTSTMDTPSSSSNAGTAAPQRRVNPSRSRRAAGGSMASEVDQTILDQLAQMIKGENPFHATSSLLP